MPGELMLNPKYNYIVHWRTQTGRYQESRFDTLSDADMFRSFIEDFYPVSRTETIDQTEEEKNRTKLREAAPFMLQTLHIIRDRLVDMRIKKSEILNLVNEAIKRAEE
jgi:hypothetical protein